MEKYVNMVQVQNSTIMAHRCDTYTTSYPWNLFTYSHKRSCTERSMHVAHFSPSGYSSHVHVDLEWFKKDLMKKIATLASSSVSVRLGHALYVLAESVNQLRITCPRVRVRTPWPYCNFVIHRIRHGGVL